MHSSDRIPKIGESPPTGFQVPASGAMVPGVHEVQVFWPGFEASPSAQSAQELLPWFGLNVPASHAVQFAAFVGE